MRRDPQSAMYKPLNLWQHCCPLVVSDLGIEQVSATAEQRELPSTSEMYLREHGATALDHQSTKCTEAPKQALGENHTIGPCGVPPFAAKGTPLGRLHPLKTTSSPCSGQR